MQMPKAGRATIEVFESLLPDHPAVTRRQMFGQPAAFVQGNMFFGVFGDAIVVKLSSAECASALRTPGIVPFEPMEGRPMRDWIALPPTMFDDRPVMEGWVRKALATGLAAPPKGSKPAKRAPARTKGR